MRVALIINHNFLTRSFCLILCKLNEIGIRCTIECATAKLFASDAAMKITTDAVQILAGGGYMKGAVVEKLFRDAKLLQIFEGTNQINRVVAGRGLLAGKSTLF